MIERIVSRKNIRSACKQVVSNQGSAEVDGMTVKELSKYLKTNQVRIAESLRGWINYFRMASMQTKLIELDGWLRNRLRYCIWEDWKKPERRRKNLIRLGIRNGQSYAWSRTRMGGWSASRLPVGSQSADQSPILGTTITMARLMN